MRAAPPDPYITALMKFASNILKAKGLDPFNGKRELGFVHGRAIMAKLLRDRGLSLMDIGTLLHRDHASVMNLLQLYTRAPALRWVAEDIEAQWKTQLVETIGEMR